MPNECTDLYHRLQLRRNPDGTFTRKHDVFPRTPPSSDPSLPIPVLTKDITINQQNNTWLRLFLPRVALSSSNPNPKKLPLILFFHGSGFVILSAATTLFHDFCVEMANTAEAIVASVDYRLAPEHRLPAAYDDAVEALRWIGKSEDEWLRHYADYSMCYVMGSSAGATIAYHAEERVELKEDEEKMGDIKRKIDISKLNIRGLSLALPIGADRDHEYCNVRAGNGVEKMRKIREVGWRVLMSGTGGDILEDREKELAQLMEEEGVQVVKDFHGIELIDIKEDNR
ncbi:unnamed protein product [Sphenostylis stenocarpa]|uniref:Alpha/beta hydrolase fold-3 domain-containing protein n=1 Tax=Sphenostylis stenocarpa TaxID=92480 RepID=A0AA86VYK2_9FABA|nr:unnamed protein product [Sphenostylis stenocarpa]